ncbi:MAG: CHAT domain-containing protein [Bacteroidota bacterium]
MDLFYFAFANDPTHPLRSLTEEADRIMELLTPGELQQRYVVVYEPFATREKISRFLTQHRDKISLFHYSGHAGDTLLETKGEQTHSEGLAHLLGQCLKLKLVFLNGCSTEGQVAGLWDAGVKSIMATSAPVEDQKASNFAKRFYQALSQEENLQQAFEQAKGDLLTQQAGLQVELHRAIRRERKQDTPEILWGLFVQEQEASLLTWTLPQAQTPPPTGDFEPNSLLVEGLMTALNPYAREVRNLVRDEEDGEEVDFADKRLAILNSLPAPIAEQLRKLMVPLGDRGKGFDQISLPRVEQLVQTYQTAIELFTFTTISQLWDVMAEDQEAKLPASTQRVLQRFFRNKLPAQGFLPLLPLLREIRSFFEGKDQAFFIDEWTELRDLYAADGPFAMACDYLDALHRRLEQEQVQPHLVSEVCRRAEQNLTTIFNSLGFLAKYTLVAVRMIDVIKFRHHPEASFRHSLVRLVKLMGGLEEREEVLDTFMDSRSVLLIKRVIEKDQETGEKKTRITPLNLSPFVIDENAFDEKSTEVSKVYFFSRYEKQQDAFVFRHAYKPADLPLVVSDQKYPVVKAQFEAFAELMFHQKLSSL